MSRTRSRGLKQYAGGTFTDRAGNTTSYPGGISVYEQFDDSTTWSKPPPDKPCSHMVRKFTPSRYSGGVLRAGKYPWGSYQNMPWGLTTHGHIGQPFFHNFGALKNEVLQRLSPHKGVVDLPLFLFELRELPALLRDTAAILAGRSRTPAGDAVLAANFGWGPLASDLNTLLNLAQETDKRIQELRNLKRTKRLEGSLAPWRGSTKTNVLGRVNLVESYIKYHTEHEIDTRAWFVAKLKAYNLPPALNTDGLERMQWALSLNVGVDTIWNAIPWSWLIDYFMSFGDYLVAAQGRLYYDVHYINIMQHSEVHTKDVVDSTYGLASEPQPGSGVGSYFVREVYNDNLPELHVDAILNDRQLTNLAALASSSRPRYSRTG